MNKITKYDIIDMIEEHGYEDVLLFENPDYVDAFLGITEDGRAVYDGEKMIEYLMEHENMTYEDAADFFSYNTVRSCNYVENSPIIMYRFYNEEG